MSIFDVSDIDSIFIKFLEINDAMRLYQVNVYYKNLLKPILKSFILFYSIAHKIKIRNHIYMNDIFAKSIIFGDIKICKYLYQKFKSDVISGITDFFVLSCIKGKLDIAMWLRSLDANVHWNDSEPFRLACQNGHLNVAQWINSITTISEKDYRRSFRFSCGSGRIHVAKWIYTLYHIYGFEHEYFLLACRNGHLDTAVWSYSFTSDTSGILKEFGFYLCCKNGHLCVAKWLYSLGTNIHYENDWAFQASCCYNRIKVAKWLCAINPQYSIQIIDGKIKYQMN